MPKLRKESLHTSQPSSSVADEQDTSTWKPKILNRSKSILSLAQDFFNLNLDNSTSTKQATDSHKSGGQSSWNPLNSLRGAKETLDRKFSTLTLRGGYAPTHPPVQSLIDGKWLADSMAIEKVLTRQKMKMIAPERSSAGKAFTVFIKPGELLDGSLFGVQDPDVHHLNLLIPAVPVKCLLKAVLN